MYQLALDVKRARAALGRDHVLLVRAHHFMATDRAWRGGDGFVVDVSDYPDIADLYLAADVLITDYSSAMFDFAVTGKPMLFFAYDLERYRDEVRGFYFDLEAPGAGPGAAHLRRDPGRHTRRSPPRVRGRLRRIRQDLLPLRRRLCLGPCHRTNSQNRPRAEARHPALSVITARMPRLGAILRIHPGRPLDSR